MGLTQLLLKFSSFPDSNVWASKEIKYLSQVGEVGSLKTFDSLKEQYNLPNLYLFDTSNCTMLFRHNFAINQLPWLFWKSSLYCVSIPSWNSNYL